MIERPANIPARLVETDTVTLARDATRIAVDLRAPVHLIGRPGTGKSSALWHIANEMEGIYCEISQASKATKGMFELLLRSVNHWDGQNYIGDLSDAVYRYFKKQERFCAETGGWREVHHLLIIDEVQTLEATALRELLRVQEKCQLGLVVAGNAERLANTRKDADTWAQIESRILMPRHLPGPSERDCELIGAEYNVEGKDAYSAIAVFGTATNFRDLVQLLETAKRLTGGSVGIRKHHLESALRLLKPNLEVSKLLEPSRGTEN